MPSYTYKFFGFPNDNIERPYLPLNIINPFNKKGMKWMCLLDTGADSCLIGKEICSYLGHNLKGDGVKSDITYGISGEDVPVWKHTYILELFHPKTDEVVWKSKRQLIDCINEDKFPVLLGSSDFLKYFKITINYPKKSITIRW